MQAHWESLIASGYMIDIANCAGHLFGVRLPVHIDMVRVQSALSQRGISVSYRGDAIRVSPNVYNIEEEMGVFTEVLLSLL